MLGIESYDSELVQAKRGTDLLLTQIDVNPNKVLTYGACPRNQEASFKALEAMY